MRSPNEEDTPCPSRRRRCLARSPCSASVANTRCPARAGRAPVRSRRSSTAARTAADPKFRALVAQIYGSAVTHPLLMQTYWDHHIQPRRALAIAMFQRAQHEGAIAEDADLDVLVDMLAGAVTYRVLQPNPPTERQIKRYLESAYRHVGLLP